MSRQKFAGILIKNLCLGALFGFAHTSLAEADLPASGRSIFDHVMAEESNGKVEFNVPFPFEKLTEKIAKKVLPSFRQPSLSMIPFGRSLQKFAADPDFFKFPRLLMGMPWGPVSNLSELGFNAENKLFVGYVEPSDELEVISYNETLGRFEFQIVKDYAPGKTPKIYYVKRELCTGCHQNGGPIFPESPWSEFNANFTNLTDYFIRRAHPGKSDLHGVPFDDSPNTLEEFDFGAENAFQLLVFQDLWQNGCGEDLALQRECRALMVERALARSMRMAALEDDEAKRLREIWQGTLPTRYPQGLLTSDQRLNDRDPFTNGSGSSPGEDRNYRDWPESKLTGMMRDLMSTLPREMDPLIPRSTYLKLEVNSDNGPRSVFVTMVSNVLTASDIRLIEAQFKGLGLSPESPEAHIKLRKALNEIVANHATGTSQTFDKKPLRRSDLMRDLLSHLGVANPPKSCCQNDYSENPPSMLPVKGLLRGQVKDPDLRRYFVYCDACHRQPISNNIPDFLFGENEDEIWNKLKAKSERIRARLTSDDRPMPPMASSQHQMLKEHDSDRQELLNSLKP